jgi:hypothetical protein
MDRSSAIARILSARARFRRSHGRDQQGFVLVLVLGVVFFFALVGAAILSQTTTSGRVVTHLASSTATTREYDGALEKAVSWFRTQASHDNADCTNPAPNVPDPALGPTPNPWLPAGSYTFSCIPGSVPPGQEDLMRLLEIDVSKDGFLVARAQVRFHDKTDSGVDLLGYTVEVCDWQLGDQVNTGLQDCG